VTIPSETTVKGLWERSEDPKFLRFTAVEFRPTYTIFTSVEDSNHNRNALNSGLFEVREGGLLVRNPEVTFGGGEFHNIISLSEDGYFMTISATTENRRVLDPATGEIEEEMATIEIQGTYQRR